MELKYHFLEVRKVIKEYYIVKNSWGETNDYKGFLFVTKNFVKYKTTALMVNKGGIPVEIAKKLGV